jgi:hypothetical protein
MAEATQERKLLGVGCRVEPMVTHPAPPQTRTCAIRAYGPSSKAAAARARIPLLHRPLACRGQGWCAQSLCPVSCQQRLCATAPSLPWVAWASLPHLPRYSAPLPLPPCPARVASLVARFPLPGRLPSFGVSLTGSGPGGSSRSRQGFCSPGPPCRVCNTETRGSPTFPRSPSRPLPRSQTPVGACALAIAHPGLRPSGQWQPSAFLSIPLRDILLSASIIASATLESALRTARRGWQINRVQNRHKQ